MKKHSVAYANRKVVQVANRARNIELEKQNFLARLEVERREKVAAILRSRGIEPLPY